MASPVTTRPRAPTASRFAWAIAAVSGSSSTPLTRGPGTRERQQVGPDAAPEVAHGGCAGRDDPAGAVLGDVAVGRLLQASGVKNSRAASAPNFGSALRRSVTWVSAAATYSGR